MDHEHRWEPAPLQFQRYLCACGATGYRKGREILPHKQRLDLDRSPETFVGRPNMGEGNAHRGKSGPGSW